MPLPALDSNRLIEDLTQLLNLPSPTGYTGQAIDWLDQRLSGFPQLQLARTPTPARQRPTIGPIGVRSLVPLFLCTAIVPRHGRVRNGPMDHPLV